MGQFRVVQPRRDACGHGVGDNTARVWRSFPDVNKLIGIVRAGPRCLSQAERDAYGLGGGPAVLPTLQVPIVPADRSFIPLPKQDGSCN